MTLFLEAAATTGVGGGMPMLLMIIIMFAVFYFFVIRPENKKKKKTEEMRNSLSLGDEIITIGGMIGKIVQITDDTITFETGEDRVRIQTKKWAISTTAKMEAEEAKKSK
ncbi:MAG: preprotein translocase subunit YajC [Erysipelotrichaceae bacterium]|nr:preprotein translocase subunit YajC [Erysipelotrichaceae bacterium]